MEMSSNIQNRFGEARANGDGITFQAGVNTGTININRGSPFLHERACTDHFKFPERPRNTTFPKAAYDATFDAANKEHVASCLPGTRVEVLEEIQEWIDGDNMKKLYWLNGMAGTGKSTIALTLARTYKHMVEEKNVRLGATFFFSRGGGDLASASKFAATVAIQLAEVSVELRNLVDDVFESNPRLESLSVQEQWDKLIITPLSQLGRVGASNTQRNRLLVVVDALDECNSTDDVIVLIQCLEKMTNIEGTDCRVFITSRPDQPIRVGLNSSTSVPRENFILHDIERSIVDEDLRLYYRDQLDRIKATTSSNDDILSEGMIESLVQRSHSLFIHAATVCRFVRDGRYLAVERLNRLARSEKADSAERELDKMYATILEHSFDYVTEGLSTEETEKIHELFQRIIGAIITISDAMSSETLALFLAEKREKIDMILGALHSVVDVPESNHQLIRILHPSFRDFLLDAKRCTDSSYSILAEDAHGYLLKRCFELLMSQLKQNPLRMTRPGAKVRDATVERIDACIPMPLQYASGYWWHHFKNSGKRWRESVPLSELLKGKYLYWLECLSWTGQLEQAVIAMLGLNTSLVSHFPRDLEIQDLIIYSQEICHKRNHLHQ